MSRNRITIIILFFVILIIGTKDLSGQKWTMNLDLYPNWSSKLERSLIVPYGGLGLRYHYEIKNIRSASGMGFRSILWGNEVSLDQVVTLPVYKKDGLYIENENTIHLSYPLFYNKHTLAMGASSKLQFENKRFSRFRFYLGIRYSKSLLYREYNTRNFLLEGNIGCNIVLKK